MWVGIITSISLVTWLVTLSLHYYGYARGEVSPVHFALFWFGVVVWVALNYAFFQREVES